MFTLDGKSRVLSDPAKDIKCSWVLNGNSLRPKSLDLKSDAFKAPERKSDLDLS